jgi:hypothetical protein
MRRFSKFCVSGDNQPFSPDRDLITPPIRPELLDELLKDYENPEDLLGHGG